MNTISIDEIVTRLGAMSAADKKAITDDAAYQAAARMLWLPHPGPQTEAYWCLADTMLYGGQGGGGKSDLGLGLAFTQHHRTLVVRRHYADLAGLTERAVEVNTTRDGFSSAPRPKLRTKDDRLIEFGACQYLGDEQHWQGQPHDLLVIDEAVQLLEKQVRFLMGWVRSTVPGQRKRTILASNPPVSAEGQWIIGMFAPWLDPTHPNPARHGELRWFITDPDGHDKEVDGPKPVTIGDKTLIPQSRTFIPAALKDNPSLANTGYQAQLDALPEPYRSAVRDGNFMAARKDDQRQVIPTGWVIEAQKRWTQQIPRNAPMCAIAADVAAGGDDETVLATRYDGYFTPLIAVPGKQTPRGSDVAALIVLHRRGNAEVVVDMGGGYGGAPKEHLEANGIDVVGYKGAEASTRRSRQSNLKFTNKRSASWWAFREALDPDQEYGSPIALPPDPMLVADLTAPTFEIGPNGIKVEPKDSVCDRLGRSTDRGDAVVMCWSAGDKVTTQRGGTAGYAPGEHGTAGLTGRHRTPVVITGRSGVRSAVGR